MRRLLFALAFSAVALPAAAIAQTTYTGTRTTGANSATFSLTTVNTVTTLQVLQDTDVASWSVSLTGNSTFSFNDSSPGSVLSIFSDGLTADASRLFFNYDGDGLVDFFNYQTANNELNFCGQGYCGGGLDTIVVNEDHENTRLSSNQLVGVADAATPEPASGR